MSVLKLNIISRFGARFSGLLFAVLLLGACDTVEEVEEEIEEEAITVPAYQYPIDSLWRGIPLDLAQKEYKKNQFPNYIDSMFIQIEAYEQFHYPYGVLEADVPALLLAVQQKKLARIRYLRDLGIPIYRDQALNIKYLNLSERDLVVIPPEIGILKNMEELLLAYNDIRRISPQLQFCKKLRRLDLTSNIIEQLPFYVGNLQSLEELSLRDNRLSGLPNSLSKLKNLKTLDISNMHRSMAKGNNNFSYIPPSVCHLPNLERLLMEKLPIRQIPVSLLYLKNLKVLSLSGCYMLNMNNTFRILAQMPSLQVLDISFTGRARLPNEILMMKNLKVLIWQEEGNLNKAEIKRLKNLMPNTKIYSGATGESRPFLRGNSIKTIINAGY
jgi:hypothetical protein